jgi:serine/threonine protein kinase
MRRIALEFMIPFGSDVSGGTFLGRVLGTETLVLLQELTESGAAPEVIDELELWAERLAGLESARLVRTLGSTLVDERLFLVSEWVPGLPLAHLSDHPLSTLAYVGREALVALDEIQKECARVGLPAGPHGHLTPLSIVLSMQGQVRVAGFGRAFAAGALPLDTHCFLWAAPERKAVGRLDERVDIYSVGAILWEAAGYHLANRSGQARVAGGAGAPSGFGGDDDAFFSCLRRALHPNPGRRYPDALKFAAALGAYIEAFGTGAEAVTLEGWIKITFPGSSSDARAFLARSTERTPRPEELMDIDLALDFDETTAQTDLSYIARVLTAPRPETKPVPLPRSERGPGAAMTSGFAYLSKVFSRRPRP